LVIRNGITQAPSNNTSSNTSNALPLEATTLVATIVAIATITQELINKRNLWLSKAQKVEFF